MLDKMGLDRPAHRVNDIQASVRTELKVKHILATSSNKHFMSDWIQDCSGQVLRIGPEIRPRNRLSAL